MNVQQFPASMGDFSTFEVPGYAGKTKIYKNIYYKVVRYFAWSQEIGDCKFL